MGIGIGASGTDENILKIDAQSTDGLAGTNNSLAYRVHEIEKHFHSIERWYGNDGDSTMSVANNLTPWTLTAGGSANVYGTEVLLGAANDVKAADHDVTPLSFDAHRIIVTESDQNDKNYMIQLWTGTGTFANATLRSEVPYRTASNSAEAQPISCQMRRASVAEKVWARVKCETAGKTLEIIIGLHVYVG